MKGANCGGEWFANSKDYITSVNPTTGEVLARIEQASAKDYDKVMKQAQQGLPGLARTAGAQARRDRPPGGRGPAREEGHARRPGQPGDGQDLHRGSGRGAGDDRHLRLRRRPEPQPERPDPAERAAQAPHDGAVASAGRGRRHQRLQLPGGRLGLEHRPGLGLRRHLPVEAVEQDARCAPSPARTSSTRSSRPTACPRASAA